ncbi:MAG: hypothetical protein JW726_15590 [Anaerolineales bacterium]|nr:hypothetical protein [Anaerolineales bacterium]
MSELLALCARLPGNDLVAAECVNLTGGRPDADGVAPCRSLEFIPRAAYVTTGVRRIATAPTIDVLAQSVAQMQITAENFRVEFLRFSSHQEISKSQAILAIANALKAYPNLSTPTHRFLIGVQANGVWLGEIVNEADASYRTHDAKPYRTSSSLPARLARALVNLVSPPAQTILDPFCGTGAILLEAAASGIQARGSDHNPKMVGMSRRNLAHFGYSMPVERLEARECRMISDAIVTDLPYGRLLEQDQAALLPIFKHLSSLARQAIYLAEHDITPWLQQAGYRQVEVLQVRKRPGFSRFVHRAQS